MLRKGMSKRKLSMDLQLLLHRGKIAGKALGKLITAHGHHDDRPAAPKAPPPPFSCRALDPALAVYDPRGAGLEVEFSCSNTPSYPPIHLIPTKRARRRGSNRRTHRGANGAEPGWYNYDAADIAKVFEVLNDEQLLNDVGGDGDGAAALAVLATPSPALWSSFGRSPAAVRQLRITDSPFPLRDDAADQDGGLVDREADEFIRKFYDQLRTQQSLAVATPEYGYARPATGVAY
jgi:hypothetical protein